jgi:hypothetical protein
MGTYRKLSDEERAALLGRALGHLIRFWTVVRPRIEGKAHVARFEKRNAAFTKTVMDALGVLGLPETTPPEGVALRSPESHLWHAKLCALRACVNAAHDPTHAKGFRQRARWQCARLRDAGKRLDRFARPSAMVCDERQQIFKGMAAGVDDEPDDDPQTWEQFVEGDLGRGAEAADAVG